MKTNNVGFGNPILEEKKKPHQIDLNKLNISFIGDGGVSDAVRLRLPAEKLMENDEISGSFTDLSKFREGELGRIKWEQLWDAGDEVYEGTSMSVITRPVFPELVGGLRDKYGHFIVADVDDDFHSIPKSHVGYRAVGPGNQDFLERHRVSLRMADLVTTTTPELAARLSEDPIGVKADRVRIVPNGWGDNEWWGRTQQRDTVNIGWGGTITHRADFLLCLDALVEIAEKYKSVKIVIAADPEIYRMLKAVREEQKMFLPMVRYEDYPHTLTYYDILIAPLEDTRFNNAKSDIKLVDAGAARIPFVASDVPIYRSDLWRECGFLVRGKAQWFDALEELVLYPETRERMGEECGNQAELRHMNKLSQDWLKVYKEAS